MIYHGLQGKVYKLLQLRPLARERRNKDYYLVRLLTDNKQWDTDMAVFRVTELVEMAKDFNSADRYWRLLTSAHLELRGSDYDTKQIVEQRKELELGYEVGFHEINKKVTREMNEEEKYALFG